MPDLIDRWIVSPTEKIHGLSLSGRRAAVVVRHNHTIGYLTAIGFVATYLPFEKKTAKDAWELVPNEVGETLWSGETPTPADIMNWLQWHSESTLKDIIVSCYGRSAPKIDLEDLRHYIGYRYQIDFYTAHPDVWETLASRPFDPTVLERWRENVRAYERDTSPVLYIPKGAPMNAEETQPTPETPEPAKPAAVVKKKPPAATEKKPTAEKKTPEKATVVPIVTKAVKGTGTTKPTRAKAPKGPKAVKPPKEKAEKAPRKARASSSDDPYTKKKLDVQAKLKIGEHVTYHGNNKAFAEKRVKIVGHEARGGIIVEMGDKKLVCSPFALLEKKSKPKSA